MNAEALVGKVLGACTLQGIRGQGSMGVVYQAEQAHPRRKVAVKVFLRASSLNPLQHMEFLLRFRQEMEAVASLEHPNILVIYEYGERDGFVHLVMPYVEGQTLQEVLLSQGLLPFPKVVDYLDQLAAALDYAHERGVLHQDIKPANILVAADGRLLLSDFALSKVMTEKQAVQLRQFRAGMLDYQSPEQVMGKETGLKSDLYSLGAVLYHMATGTAPFQGESLIEVAKKHLQVPPPSPSSKRKDLPVKAGQVMLRALSKHPANRFANAQDLATAFRLALDAAQTKSGDTQEDELPSRSITSTSLYTAQDLFDPKWRTGGLTPTVIAEQSAHKSPRFLRASAIASIPSTDEVANVTNSAVRSEQASESEEISLSEPGMNPITPLQDTSSFPAQTTNLKSTLVAPNTDQANTGTIIKLTGPVKIVNLAVAGQPGRYVTGLLPILPPAQQAETQPTAGTSTKDRLQKRLKILGLVMVALLVIGTGTLWLAHIRSSSTAKNYKSMTAAGTPAVEATMTAQAIATANANIILTDPLTQNIHNWLVATSGTMFYVFKNGAYHITDNDDTRGAPAILPDLTLKGPFVYTLTMEEIKGDDTSINNEFGMIICANVQIKNGRTITTFYSLEVLNKVGGEYQFWKYDDSQGANISPWNKLGSHPFGNEFHEGQGPKSINTFKISVSGKNFTLIVNGKKVWAIQDSSLSSGSVGMLVNLKGTEVAFSNLKLTYS
jgi:serine/threonine protein kinase